MAAVIVELVPNTGHLATWPLGLSIQYAKEALRVA